MNKYLAAALLAAPFAIATSAQAADVVFMEPTPVIPLEQGIDWSGFYVGAHGGYGWADSDAEFVVGVPGALDFDLDGGFVGGQVGYNYVFPNGLLIGAEADISFGSINGGAFSAPFTTTVNMDIDMMASVRGRVGFAVGRFLPYATAGWAWANADRFSSFGGGQTVDASFDGWTLGAGVQYAIDANWSAGLEYRYTDFGDTTFDFPVGLDSNVDIQMHTARFTLNYKF